MEGVKNYVWGIHDPNINTRVNILKTGLDQQEILSESNQGETQVHFPDGSVLNTARLVNLSCGGI